MMARYYYRVINPRQLNSEINFERMESPLASIYEIRAKGESAENPPTNSQCSKETL